MSPERRRLPLSASQSGIWYAQGADPGSPAYHTAEYVEITGELDTGLFVTAARQAAGEAECFGTVFGQDEDGTPWQETGSAATAEIPVVAAGDADAALAWMREDLAKPSDLATGPLAAQALLTVGPGRAFWYLRCHHLLLDGYGFSLVQQRVAEIYSRLARGGEPGPTPFASVADFLAEEQEYHESAEHDADRAFWVRAWENRARPRPLETSGLKFPVTVRETAPSSVAGLPRWPETLITGFGAFWYRFTGESAVTLGLPTLARPTRTAARTPTTAVNVLPLAIEPGPDATASALIEATQEEMRQYRAHQRFRGEELRRELGLSGSGNRLCGPLVNIRPPVPSLRFGDCRGETRYVSSGPVDELSVTAHRDSGGSIVLTFHANPDVYDEESLQDMAKRFSVFLDAFATGDPRLSDLDVLLPGEREKLTAGASVEPAERTLTGRFAEVVAGSAARIAVSTGDDTLTYAELDARANRLAHRLRRDGAGPGAIVALSLPRSADLVVAILGVLKAGAAYLPLDPGYPAERLAYMIEDAEPVLVLNELGDLDGFPASAPEVSIAPGDPAYVIYTSGSTGKPKGVVVPHSNVVRLLDSTRHWFEFGNEDVWALLHSYAFDFSVWELWGALGHGGRLVVVPHDVARAPGELRALLAREGVTVLNQTPSAFYQLAEQPADLPALRTVIFGGEALEPARLREWFRVHGDRKPRLVNMYGITETTVHVTYHELSASDGPESIIGEPIPDLRVYVLDRFGHPVPPGVTGELHVGGAGLSLGYLNKPELTAERFVPDPFGPAGARMYVTGDLARWTAEGRLEYRGRGDDQVKIRGYRIEPGEVTAAALSLPDVADAAVVVDDGPRLLCYAVPRAGAELTPESLRAGLAGLLPDHMLPAAALVVPHLPLTPNGKLDRAALPAPEGQGPRRGLTPAEQALCGVFEEILGVPRVGADDDFFALGGHSLLATRLISRVRAVLNAELDIRTVFTESTPARLARRLDPVRRPALRSMERPERLEPSAAQQRLWFLNRMEGPSATYNLPLSVELSGPVDVGALIEALRDVVGRHEALRTTFPARQGKPYQSIAAGADPELSLVDIEEAALPEAIGAAARQGFDLANEAPIRAKLFRVTPERHVLVLCLHHIAGDDWSLRPLTDDLAAAYTARLKDAAPDWRPLPVQYADYTLWQRELLDQVSERDLAYWREALSGLPERLDLPTDRPRPAEASNRGGQVPLALGTELHARLRELAAERGVSVFMVLHAAFAALLTRLGAGTDIPIGTPVAARTDAALHDLVGFFVNTLVLRTDTSGDPAFTELLARVAETDLAAYAHQETPFDRVVEACNPVRTPDRHPLFQVMLSFGTARGEQQWTPDLTADPRPVHTGTEKFDLTLNLAEGEAGIAGALEYATDLFDERTVRRFSDQFLRVLRGFAEDPGRRLSTVDVLGDEERELIVHTWNDTGAPITPRTLPEMIEDQVRKTPEAVAVVFEGGELTYAELNTRANRLARHLMELGVGPERTVGIHLPRSAHQVVGLLAVLKAGGAFVPLESAWPADRITGIATGADLAAIVSDSEVSASLPELGRPVVEVDRVELDGYPGEDLPRQAGMDNLAYVIYTSGSTGAPKGAMIEHLPVSNRLPWQVGLLGLKHDDAVLYKAPLSFDISVNEIFLPLVSGARLVVAVQGGERDVSYLLDLIAEQRVSFVYLVSTMLELMLERDEVVDAGRSLRHVWCGGEVLTPQLYRRFTERIDATMYHGYGPAEATIGVTCQVYRGQDPSQGITIGRPNPNNSVYILDAAGNPVPIGVAGQLHIGGVQLARGYLGDPERTAEKFIPDPFSGKPGARLYATGDLARYRPDGNIEFLGRIDNQVKIHGMRLEPEEIEATLARHPGVRQAVVVVRSGELAAYCIGEGEAVEPEEVRQWLGTQLPAHMVPAALVFLDEYPLMPSGKVDRKALPDIAVQPRRADEHVAPRTEAEKLIASIWSDTLGVPDIGVRDNFFDLGGHSLVLARVQTALQRELGHGVPMLDLFLKPTVETLAAHLASESATTGKNALGMLLPFRTEGTRPPVFCLHPASGLGWPFAGLRKHLDTDTPVYALQARGLDESRPVASSMEEMAAEYLTRVREIQPHGPYRLVGWSFGGVVAHTMATLLQDAGEEVGLLAMLDSYPAYPWEKLADDHEQQALRSLLYMSHYDLETLPEGPLDRETVQRVVADQGGVLSELDSSSITAVMNTFVNSAPLQQSVRHRVFRGDLFFFTATVNPVDPALSAKDWAPYIAGEIENVDIACEHKDMCQTGPLALIGRALEKRLAR
ncbi:amino acid adenylation domain-containing protein [Amycolatopsis acidicola]|uniref:Amino acid adenylation domain-containing protein n=1 Tax=Amycolatopsis acidicola TaxID=2596893 RepID=A0A5N0V2D4_9PSEU|nr:non-ribosomal peptide synthetase [Amycolatopsis acidicola]KAA9158725.1 amino acid adenylation domain-containing protein [Amycolatopsis acidicola]